jgi:hypothetical protein
MTSKYHLCRWPKCHRKLKYGTWCNNHYYQIPSEYKVGTRSTEPQPDELILEALAWISRACPKQCARCETMVAPGAIQIRMQWPWSDANDLVLDLCEGCAANLEMSLGIRWCETCALWTRRSHPRHSKPIGRLRVVRE